MNLPGSWLRAPVTVWRIAGWKNSTEADQPLRLDQFPEHDMRYLVAKW